jgi:hypothetical protein
VHDAISGVSSGKHSCGSTVLDLPECEETRLIVGKPAAFDAAETPHDAPPPSGGVAGSPLSVAKLAAVDIEHKAADLVDLRNLDFADVAMAMGLWGRSGAPGGVHIIAGLSASARSASPLILMT